MSEISELTGSMSKHKQAVRKWRKTLREITNAQMLACGMKDPTVVTNLKASERIPQQERIPRYI